MRNTRGRCCSNGPIRIHSPLLGKKCRRGLHSNETMPVATLTRANIWINAVMAVMWVADNVGTLEESVWISEHQDY